MAYDFGLKQISFHLLVMAAMCSRPICHAYRGLPGARRRPIHARAVVSLGGAQPRPR
jgi:hypothetical protein